MTPRLTLDLGTRFEMVRSDATGDINAGRHLVDRAAPGGELRPAGDGETVRLRHLRPLLRQVQPGAVRRRTRNVGRPSEVDYVYSGPAGQGATSRPASTWRTTRASVFASFPTANVQMADDIRSPLTREFTLGLGRELGQRGHAKATYAWRTRRTSSRTSSACRTGVTDVPLVGTLTNRVYDNTDDLYRDYQAAIFESGYRVRSSAERERPLHAAAPQPRQLRGRGGQPAGHPVGLRQLSRRSSGRRSIA